MATRRSTAAPAWRAVVKASPSAPASANHKLNDVGAVAVSFSSIMAMSKTERPTQCQQNMRQATWP